MPRKAIVVQPSGGGVFEVGSTDYVPHSDQRIDVFCYGETPYEAQKVRREVFDVLKNVRRQVINGVLVHWFQRSGGVLALRDPDTDWPVAFESWQMFFAERLVA